MTKECTRWLPFDTIAPSVGEVVVVKTSLGIYSYLVKVEGRQKYCRFREEATKVEIPDGSWWLSVGSIENEADRQAELGNWWELRESLLKNLGSKGYGSEVERKLDRIIELLRILVEAPGRG